jgi:hypothetical protein
VEGNWDSYLVDINDHIASVFLDLTLRSNAPDSSRPFLGYIWLRMRSPRPDGLSSSEEFKTLLALEKKLLAVVDKRHLAVYVGRITTQCRREFYFYMAKEVELAPAAREALMDFPDYEVDTGSQRDPEWRHYLEVMYPSPMELELIKNSQVREALAGENDLHFVPRRISHWCFFRTEAQRDLFNRELPAYGFEVMHSYRWKTSTMSPTSLSLTKLIPQMKE